MQLLTTLFRRTIALVALMAGMVLATLVAMFAFAVTLSLGAVLWLAARFGVPRVARERRPPSGGSTAVIDVEMREIDPADRSRR